LLLNSKSAILKLCHDENKSDFDEMIMMSALT
jgi:hypothetical protein